MNDALARDPDCRWCPKCSTAMIRGDHQLMLRCPGNGCKFVFCFNCKEDWHQDFTCEQYQAWKIENSQEAQRYDAWKKKNTKECPKCKTPIEKNGGCNHIQCRAPGCRHEFCWLCMAGFKGHVHEHVKGKKICKLYS